MNPTENAIAFTKALNEAADLLVPIVDERRHSMDKDYRNALMRRVKMCSTITGAMVAAVTDDMWSDPNVEPAE